MKTFKSFLQSLSSHIKDKQSQTDLDRLMKEIESQEITYHYYPSSHGELRHLKADSSHNRGRLREESTPVKDRFHVDHSVFDQPNSATKIEDIHHSDILKPRRLYNNEAVRNYTSAFGQFSSEKVNRYLRGLHKGIVSHVKELHDAAHHVIGAIQHNGNRGAITAYSGIPEHVGLAMQEKGVGSIHANPAFHSFSTHAGVAASYASRHGDDEDHVIVGRMHPGSVMSAAHDSHFANENEVVAAPGSPGILRKHERIIRPGKKPLNIYHMEYIKSNTNIDNYKGMKQS